jgi:hypothetical protein
MNLKRWFAWLCLALMLVAEILLFRANHERDVALTSMREAQLENRQMANELAELKNSNAGLQAAEITRLRKQNEILTNKLATAQTAADQLRNESQQNAQHLTTARTALQLQQDHLTQLEAENQRIADTQATIVRQQACINNLRLIDSAKQQWALDKNSLDAAVPTARDLLPYLPGGVFPVCPGGGTYSINAVNEWPGCSIAGHDLPP